MRSDGYKKIGFQVWADARDWFWFVPNRRGGVVGAALTEAGAIREAHATIETMVKRPAPRASTEAMGPRYSARSENKRYE